MPDLFAQLARPELLSFAHAGPASELFPGDAFIRANAELLGSDPAAVQYQMPSDRLKARIVEIMAERGVSCREDQIFLTAGAQHALSLLARVLLDPGSPLVLEETVYEGVEVVAAPHEPTLLTVPSHPTEGMDLVALESLLSGPVRPRFIYVIPDGHNPTGVSLPPSARIQLIELAQAHGVPIIEDDAYGLLSLDERHGRPLSALNSEGVIYVGSFSKILAPSLRLGWIVSSPELTRRLSAARHASDMDVGSLTQGAVAGLLEHLDLASHLSMLRREYTLRLDALVTGLAEFLPSAEWHRPPGGLLMWVRLPEGVHTTLLLRDAVEKENVAFVPGEMFARGGSEPPTRSLRLSFGHLPPDRIREGVERMGRVVPVG